MISVWENADAGWVILSRSHVWTNDMYGNVSQVPDFSKNGNITTFAAYGSLNLGRP